MKVLVFLALALVSVLAQHANEFVLERTSVDRTGRVYFCGVLPKVPKGAYSANLDLTFDVSKAPVTPMESGVSVRFGKGDEPSVHTLRACQQDENCGKNQYRISIPLVQDGVVAGTFSEADMMILGSLGHIQGVIAGVNLVALADAKLYVLGTEFHDVSMGSVPACKFPSDTQPAVSNMIGKPEEKSGMQFHHTKPFNGEPHEEPQGEPHHPNKNQEPGEHPVKEHHIEGMQKQPMKDEMPAAHHTDKHQNKHNKQHKYGGSQDSDYPWYVWLIIAGGVLGVLAVLLAVVSCCVGKAKCKKSCKGGACQSQQKEKLVSENCDVEAQAVPVVYIIDNAAEQL